MLKKRHDCKELSCQVLLLQVTQTRSAASLIGMCLFSLCCAQEDDDSCWEASFRGEQLASDSMKYDDYCNTKGTFIELRR